MNLTMRLMADTRQWQARMGETEKRVASLGKGVEQEGRRMQAAFVGVERASVRATTAMVNNLEKTVNRMRQLASIASGIVAGGYVIKQAAAAPMAYDRRLALMANTAFSDRSVAGRIAGKRELDSTIVGAVRTGGGTREDAAETLDSLLASGAFNAKSAGGLLPLLQKYATGAGAAPKDLANIAIRAKQNFGIRDDQFGEMFDKAIASGQAGGFELKDMARWLPQQMAAARLSGMKGMGGFERLLTANQLGVTVAGSKDEAGNNLLNLLAKINSQDTANDAKKLGINLPGRLAAGREKGREGLDTFIDIIDEVVAKNPKYKQLQQKAATATGDEKRATFASMADILQGSAIGKLIQDRQALMSVIGEMGQRDYRKRIEGVYGTATGEGDRSFAGVSTTASHQEERLANEKAVGMQTAFDSVSSGAGNLVGKLADLAQQYPGLTAATVAATTALTALAAAAAASGLFSMLTGGKGGGAIKTASKLRTTVALLAGATPSGLAMMGSGALATGGLALAGAGAAGYGIGSLAYSKGLAGTTVGDKIGETIAKTLAFFGNEEARRAVEITEKFKQAEIKGEIRVKVDQDGRIASVRATSSNSRVPMNVDAGETMRQP
ncbi:MAG: phage tail tape measure protein [Burkholderiales bacterium]|nr:phage tail tape measure protein [Burkholderiales bacterium]